MDKDQINKLVLDGIFFGKPINGKLIETHISWVVLTKRFAFKIKKPIRYSFLDFSTLDKRKFFCERELTLNRRLTDIYLDVLPIKKTDSQFSIGGNNGETIDYAISMKRLQTAKKMSFVLAKNEINIKHIKLLAKQISTFHRQAKFITTPFNKSKFKEDFNDIKNSSQWVAKNLGKNDAAIIEKACSFSDKFLDNNEKLITKRINEGFQRDVHGDLHSNNIFLYQKPIIFDCIEFNDAFRQIDVLNEVAFFCMDLEAFQQQELSSLFMIQYLKQFPCMNNANEMQLFNYFKCYRANIRAKVNALRAKQSNNPSEKEEYKNEVVKYLQLMESYLS